MADLMSDPYGTILPAEQARQSWYDIGQAIAAALEMELAGYGNGWLLHADGYRESCTVPTSLGLRIYRLISK